MTWQTGDLDEGRLGGQVTWMKGKLANRQLG